MYIHVRNYNQLVPRQRTLIVTCKKFIIPRIYTELSCIPTTRVKNVQNLYIGLSGGVHVIGGLINYPSPLLDVELEFACLSG